MREDVTVPARAVVDVWVVAPEAVPQPPTSALDAVELARAAAGGAGRGPGGGFLLGRALLRAALGERLGCAPGDVLLTASCPDCDRPHGRVLVGGGSVHVGITRAGPVVGVAVTDAGPVGIDVESVGAVGGDAVTARGLAEVALGRAERERHDRVPPHLQTWDLTRSWVRKEAVLKAAGTGLRVAPSLVDVGGDVVALPAECGLGAAQVALVDLPLGDPPGGDASPGSHAGAVGAVALRLLEGVAPVPPLVRVHDGVALLVPGSEPSAD